LKRKEKICIWFNYSLTANTGYRTNYSGQ